MPRRSLRVACVQFTPCFKDVEGSIRKADGLISGVQPGSLDLLVRPEMAFTGYCFKDRTDVEPFVEEAEGGRTAEWARGTARRLGCYVLVGLPTRSSAFSPSFSSAPSSSSAPSAAPAFYNSLLCVSPSGAVTFTYHKHFLFETDETWATPGPFFRTFDLPFPPSSPFHSPSSTFRLAPAICMDLNPHQFKAPFDAFEFGSFAAREKADIVVCSMAWLDSEPPATEDEEEKEGGGGWEEVSSTLGYWALRVDPLLGSGAALVCANRTGRDGETTFTGSSCAMELDETPGVVAFAGKQREELLVARVRLPEVDKAE
ncbi:hypothetical protein JCM8097_002617 [Rhodosporidiobolus ruineniae]